MSWQDISTAPAPGTVVCKIDEVEGVKALDLAGFPLLVVRDADGLRGFVNLCPHQYLPLDYQGTRILSADGARLICSSHQAQFDCRTGAVIAGPAGCGLDPVPLRQEADRVVIAEG
ncbi:Ferredoxin subunit of nitrite reductase or a ring-hydroxylating dioxygenase [Paracoccus isoporae]|uniref:Ferredoxin subunit of nitrite reductase or a ring-hydroxylating dioxygenase n=1 Tax=Paracoccus isoporae TaxID=591205 RepID=A0A1G6UQD7_9RHOB|nr:Rieske (2Fe-2S) protein [Paracoccus isoporae]SDD42757.1 Ferredoxin subunit of nitrite reductase or a ring-hydroxylating dioxygenase [Paracoccus isoporae]